MESAGDGTVALVVDDDPVTRLLVRRALEGFGFRPVLEAADGLAAQVILTGRDDVDLVLTDVLMPGLDGLGLLRWGRERDPTTMWIILSGLDTFSTAVEAIRLGAFDFLGKPPRVEEIEVSVRNALEQRKLLEERERLNAELAEANSELVSKVRELETKSELLRRDLQRAEVIQRALLPSDPPAIERFSVHAVYRPGQHVGGDLYDVVRIDERHLAFYVADATGHGVSAAMLSVLFKQRLVLVDEAGGALAPAEVLGTVNRSFSEAVVAPGLFLTAVYCLLDTTNGTVRLASAGHPPVLHVRPGGETRLIRRTGPALGLTPDAEFEEEHFQLSVDDRLLLYTDGLLQSGAAPESERLHELLSLNPADADKVLGELLAAARETRPAGGADASDTDDVTLLLLDVRVGPSRFDNGTARANREAPGGTTSRSEIVFYGETEEASYLALRGRATWVHGDAFYETACGLLETGRILVLDLSGCDYLDSTFLGTVHELAGHPEVRMQGVTPEVRAMFEELSMGRVLEAIREDGARLPEMHPLAVARADAKAGKLRVLRAHEALSAISGRNREKFQAVVESLRGDPAG
ncbi:MAG: SpoIIE family protein phosphatase [Gemmatimonadetes bacterium]|nr:SpoIIE family protein phosphatase [Gemmatimonadota bacterium]